MVSDIQIITWCATRRSRIREYFRGDGEKKLHLGASNSILKGWLNTDIFPLDRSVVYLDATRRFPFEDDSFDYVMAEHMIEHIEYEGAVTMLRECRRVLKPGGRVRLATPDLEVLLALHGKDKSDSQRHYIDWIVEHCLPGTEGHKDVFVINNAFRAWGHCFLYDKATLRGLLEDCGFGGIRFFKPGESEDPELRGLESHGREIQAEEINQFESMVIEAEVV